VDKMSDDTEEFYESQTRRLEQTITNLRAIKGRLEEENLKIKHFLLGTSIMTILFAIALVMLLGGK